MNGSTFYELVDYRLEEIVDAFIDKKYGQGDLVEDTVAYTHKESLMDEWIYDREFGEFANDYVQGE